MLIRDRAWGFVRIGRNGRFGVRVPEFGVGGTHDNPLLNDADAGDEAAGVEFCPVFADLPSSGTLTVWSDGGLALVGADDGSYVIPYALYTFTPGDSAATDEGDTSVTVTVGAGAQINCAGIASGEVFGSPAVGVDVVVAGVASAEALGSAAVAALIAGAGIASAEAVGAPAVTSSGEIACAGIASAEAFGSAAIGCVISAAGAASAEVFGQPIVGAAAHDVIASGIASGEACGSAALTLDIVCTGIASAAVFGLPVVGDTSAVWPDPATVLAGIAYGPTGTEYTGTLALLTAAQVWNHGSRTLTGIANANVTQVRGQTLDGTGTEADPWGPA